MAIQTALTADHRCDWREAGARCGHATTTAAVDPLGWPLLVCQRHGEVAERLGYDVAPIPERVEAETPVRLVAAAAFDALARYHGRRKNAYFVLAALLIVIALYLLVTGLLSLLIGDGAGGM